MSDNDIKLLRRAAEDACDACNRHYGPFIDVVAHPLRILGVLDRVKAADAEIARLSAALAEKSAQLEAERARNAEAPVAWMLEWTCNGEERGQRLYDDERHCIFDAESDGGVVVPLLRGEPLTTTTPLAIIPGESAK